MTFELTDSKLNPDRKVEAVKAKIKKYIKRERRKQLPEGFDFWDFDCVFGDSPEEKKKIHVTEIPKYIDDAVKRQLKTFYIELLSQARKRTKKPGVISDAPIT